MAQASAIAAADPISADPRHYRRRDGRVVPVTGTHVAGEICSTCVGGRIPTRVLARTFAIGAVVSWRYGTGETHGRVINQYVTRLRIYWHAPRPRAVVMQARKIRARIGRVASCSECEAGR